MNWVTRVGEALWGLWAWLAFIIACIVALIVVIFVPGQDRRRRLASFASRIPFYLTGTYVSVRGIDNLPMDNCIVVANHASYVDGFLLKGYLPPRFGMVIKGEMRNVPVAHFLLRRSGSKFVERNEHSGSARDARQIVKAAQDGESLGFFPEGTFRLEPGVGRFRAGAFLAAVKGEMPVVPIAISGTRDMLCSGQFWPRPSNLKLDILPAIAPGDDDFTSTKHLAEASRQRILAVLDEPDLLADDTT